MLQQNLKLNFVPKKIEKTSILANLPTPQICQIEASVSLRLKDTNVD